jgi:hypothetical protein
MKNLPLRLRTPLSKLEQAIAKFYLQLQQRFESNSLVSESWAAMGSDLQAQAESIKKLPPSFWQSLKKQEKELIRATGLILPNEANKAETSLQSCLVQMLDIEEPMILKVYAPLIRRLRSEWTEKALDFYVMVQAHIARLARTVQAYSGDPGLSLRCAVLFHEFEKNVQEPAASEVPPTKPTRKKVAVSKSSKKAAASRHQKAAVAKRRNRALDELSKRRKPLGKKIEIAGRRVRL